MIFLIIYPIISFFIAAIPTGIIIGKIRKIDIRNVGSKNIGATNVTRALGPVYGLLTLIIDSSKAFIPLFLFKPILLYFKLESFAFGIDFWISIIALFTICGNTFSPFTGFSGGKGVATGLGVMLFLNPIGVFISFFVFIIVVLISKFISLGSIVSVFVIIITSFFFIKSYYIIISIVLIGTIILIRHKDNIKRLLNSTENKFSLKNKK